MSVRLRPHHLLCSVGFVGEGYDAAFTANVTHLVLRQLRGPGGGDLRVFVTGGVDTICAPCPKRRDLECELAVEAVTFDTRVSEALDIEPGDTLRWSDCLDRIRERVAPPDLDRLCAGCRWLDSGMCKAAIGALRDDTPATQEGRVSAAPGKIGLEWPA